MANNNYTTLIVQPFFPKALLTPEDFELFTAFDMTVSNYTEDTVYVRCEYYNGSGSLFENGGEIYLNHEDFVTRLQAMLKRIDSDELRWISLEATYSCDKVRPDGFGAAVTFITKNGIEYLSTSSWQEERINEVETGDFGPHTNDPTSPLPIIAVVLEDGLVQTICSDQPEFFAGMDVVVIDYDKTGSPHNLVLIPEKDGSSFEATVSLWDIDSTTALDLQGLVDVINERRS